MFGRVKQQWFLFGLGLSLSLGFAGESLLGGLLQWPAIRSGLVMSVMLITGVSLQADAIGKSFTQPAAAILAVSINVFVVPLSCFLAWQVLPPKLGAGLYVAGLVPCTLASAAIWTRRAGGDDSVALLTTVITNLVCVATVPVGLWLGMGQSTEIAVSDQVTKLFWIIVVPLFLAQIARRLGLAAWADRNKRHLSTIAQIGILVMVFFGSLASRRLIPGRMGLQTLAWGGVGLFLLLLACIAVHCTALCLGIRSARGIGLGRGRQIAVGFAGSQKTLMVGLQIAIDCGVSVVPMIAYHLIQLTLDTWVADRWSQRSDVEPVDTT